MNDWAIILDPDDPGDRRFRVGLGTYGDTVYRAERFRPVLVFGPQRSYKTSGIAVPTILEWEGPAVITSVRRDVLDETFAWRDSMGRVAIFDPSGALKGTRYEAYRYSWDCLDQCRSWDDCVRLGQALTEAGRLGGVTDERFWHALAGQLLAPFLFAGTLGNRTMGEVVDWIRRQEEADARSILEIEANERALASAENTWKRHEKVRDSVYTTASSALRVFDYMDLSVDQPPFLDLDSFIGSQADTLYICAPPDEQEEFRPLFTGLVRTVIRCVYAVNVNAIDAKNDQIKGEDGSQPTVSRAPCPLLLLLDEAGNIAPLENLGTLATTAAGTGIQLVTIFHDLSQMEGLYDRYIAQSIVSNHSATIVLPGIRDQATLSYLEALLTGERVANTREGAWNTPRPIRGMKRGDALMLYENLRPIVLALRSKFTSTEIADRVRYR
ncbi:hypothetical protein BKM31_04990 [[Actinomadura] parvosata subsp. kistnae]|uniref:TraD/TraG TraM recognition site domain-containing protein n=1 Tax=[Actinomadura] parvosata subsp. kistnae TaxID=1909395 RepID=A0A1U9ZSJ2_9ACTN|nr:type IV secretory system conjugative DNA transfer family protein [Nonomuraea sp. ATCC 55076]AQZ60930.1 hypothetical protein BKM31_04990 [Nonomuraea sp. ATCC 55076]